MQLPDEIPVMILPNATLFPQAMLPLYIFEPRYRQLLSNALDSHRMFSVAMQKPGRKREMPSAIAGLGLIRASVKNKDGTSHLVLQGIARVKLEKTVRYKPYRVQRFQVLETTGTNSLAIDALTSRVIELVSERLDQGPDLPVHVLQQLGKVGTMAGAGTPNLPLKQVMKYLVNVENPEHLADLVSCTMLSDPRSRQVILETSHLETRLKYLIHFLIDEIRNKKRKA